MWAVPLEVQLNWPVPNYHNPTRKGPAIWIVTSIWLSIATVCVSARLYSRIFIRRWFGFDDALIVVAFLSTIGVNICVGIGNTSYDWDKHVWDMRPSKISPSIKILYLSRIFWGIATSCVRFSILCLYYRLLDRCQSPRHFRWILHGVTIFTIGLFLEYLFTGILPCFPISDYWTYPPPPDQKCINDGLSMKVAAVLNTLSELVIAILPMIAVYRLRVDARQRWSVISLLSLSFFVAIAGCFRTYYVWRTVDSYDISWWGTPHWICSEVEIDTALICACAAPLRPVIGRLIQRFRGLSSTLSTLRLPSTKASPGTTAVGWSITSNSQSTVSRKPSAVGLDLEAHAAWSKAIDIEGLGLDDGLGYTVIITGPTRPGRRKLSKQYWSRHGTGASEEKQHRRRRTTEFITKPDTVVEKPGFFEVTTQKTFEVSEEFHACAGRVGAGKERICWGESLTRLPQAYDDKNNDNDSNGIEDGDVELEVRGAGENSEGTDWEAQRWK